MTETFEGEKYISSLDVGVTVRETHTEGEMYV